MPAISVIIPMYNAEKYIGECLDSILNQTFQNFEVIVVDDCSTDNSFAIAESYVEKFGGRMSLIKAERNFGCEGNMPRNIGLKRSRGEYIFFVDADDFVVETALEILYLAATQYEADVVYTSHYYFHDGDDKIHKVVDKESFGNDKMILTVDDSEKICEQLFVEKGIYHMPWTKFVKREFLIANEIEFPQIIAGGDFIWTIQVVYYAKRFLRLPIALYFYNENPSSATRKKDVPDKEIVNTVKAFLMGAKALCDLSNRLDLLKRNKSYLHYSMRAFFDNCLARNFEAREQISDIELYEILCDGLAAEDSSAKWIISFLISRIDSDQKNLLQFQQRIVELENEVTRLKGKE